MNMPRALNPIKRWYITQHLAHSFYALYTPVHDIMATVPPLESRGNRPLQMSFEEHLKALIFSS